MVAYRDEKRQYAPTHGGAAVARESPTRAQNLPSRTAYSGQISFWVSGTDSPNGTTSTDRC